MYFLILSTLGFHYFNNSNLNFYGFANHAHFKILNYQLLNIHNSIVFNKN